MKFLIWLLVLFAAAVAVTLASHNSGYVLLAYPPYRVEMSLTLFVPIFVPLRRTVTRSPMENISCSRWEM